MKKYLEILKSMSDNSDTVLLLHWLDLETCDLYKRPKKVRIIVNVFEEDRLFVLQRGKTKIASKNPTLFIELLRLVMLYEELGPKAYAV